VAIEAGNLTPVRDDLRVTAVAIRLARRTQATIKGNLYWAFGWNVTALPQVTSDLLNLMITGFAMAFSSAFAMTEGLHPRTSS
jgi:Cu+-exporting ATPase